MCGRYTFATPVGTLAEEFGLVGPLPEVWPSYNVAPTQQVAAVLAEDGVKNIPPRGHGSLPGQPLRQQALQRRGEVHRTGGVRG